MFKTITMVHYLFSYGTLQKQKVQMALFGRKLAGVSDELCGYKQAEIDITNKAFLDKGEAGRQQTLMPTGNSGDCVKGTAFRLSPGELLLAVQYEPVNYKRIQVNLKSGKTAWIYLAADTTSHDEE